MIRTLALRPIARLALVASLALALTGGIPQRQPSGAAPSPDPAAEGVDLPVP